VGGFGPTPNGVSPARDAGVKAGDVIVEFNGKKVLDDLHLRLMVSQTPPKTETTLKVVREGKEKTFKVTLAELPAQEMVANGALLVDAIHFFRGGNRPQDLARVPRERLRYMQFCDARPEVPTDMQEMIRQARGDRLFPGDGGLDLVGLLRALPADLPISLEIPHAKPMPALERVRRALAATRAVLEKL